MTAYIGRREFITMLGGAACRRPPNAGVIHRYGELRPSFLANVLHGGFIIAATLLTSARMAARRNEQAPAG